MTSSAEHTSTIIQLTGEGLAHLTPDRLQTLNDTIRDLGLVATLSDETMPAQIEMPRSSAGQASYLSMLHHAASTLSDFIGEHTSERLGDAKVALNTLADEVLWDPIQAGAANDPDFFGEVARILATSDITRDKQLASKVTYEVFMQHLIRGEYEAATLAVGIWERLLKPTTEQEIVPVPNEINEAASVLSEPVVFGDHPELEPFLERLVGLIQRR